MATQPQQDDYATSWGSGNRDGKNIPLPGDTIEGTVSSLDMAYSTYGDYPIITIQLKDGSERSVHAFHQALRGKLTKMRPKIGDHLFIRYRGERESRSGTKYHDYVVKSKTISQEEFWGESEQPRARRESDVTPADAREEFSNTDEDDDIPF